MYQQQIRSNSLPRITMIGRKEMNECHEMLDAASHSAGIIR